MLGCNTTTIPYFIVMEYVSGGSLSAEIKRSGSIPLQESMVWLRQIINGLQHLHQSKLLHRDLKSMNVMIKDAEVKGGSTHTGKLSQGGLSKAVGLKRRTMKIVDFGETKNLHVPSTLTLEVRERHTVQSTQPPRAPPTPIHTLESSLHAHPLPRRTRPLVFYTRRRRCRRDGNEPTQHKPLPSDPCCASREWSCLVAADWRPTGCGNPAGRVNTPASPVLPLEGAGRGCELCATSMRIWAKAEFQWNRREWKSKGGQLIELTRLVASRWARTSGCRRR